MGHYSDQYEADERYREEQRRKYRLEQFMKFMQGDEDRFHAFLESITFMKDQLGDDKVVATAKQHKALNQIVESLK